MLTWVCEFKKKIIISPKETHTLQTIFYGILEYYECF